MYKDRDGVCSHGQMANRLTMAIELTTDTKRKKSHVSPINIIALPPGEANSHDYKNQEEMANSSQFEFLLQILIVKFELA